MLSVIEGACLHGLYQYTKRIPESRHRYQRVLSSSKSYYRKAELESRLWTSDSALCNLNLIYSTLLSNVAPFLHS